MGLMLLSRRTLIAALALLGCLVLVGTSVSVYSMHSWQVKKNLKTYAGQLEAEGFAVLEQSAARAKFDLKRAWFWFGDFHSYAIQENVTAVYTDSDMGYIYFMAQASSSDVRVEQNVFYCGITQ
jgi:hypothetical protein